jgi:putative GTP pyrophosphokinase
MSLKIWEWDELLLPYRQAVRELCVKFEAYTSEFGGQGEYSHIESVQGRVKRVSSILEKKARKNVDYDDFHDLAYRLGDIAGVRIVCRFEEDIKTVVKMIHKRNGLDLHILDERDYITHKKKSGYRSHHIHVRYTVSMRDGPKDVIVELQVRTMAMNIWASIEHSLKYKYKGDLPEHLQQRLFASADVALALDREMAVIRDEIIEARNLIAIKHDLGDEILRNMEILHLHNPEEDIAELNQEFIALNEINNLEELRAFNQRLRIMAHAYDEL